MNRDTKYRIWNPHSKKMLFDIDNVFECLKQQIKSDKVMPDRGFISPFDHFSEGMRWMQTIGKRDYYGNPIYEEDVCLLWCDSYSDKLGFCKKEWNVIVVFDETKLQYVFRGLGDYSHLVWTNDMTDFNGKPYRLKVLGDIYSNPNLLENEPRTT